MGLASIIASLTPSFSSAAGGQPFHTGTATFPRYCTSFHPIALEKNPDQRFQTAEEFLRGLNLSQAAAQHDAVCAFINPDGPAMNGAQRINKMRGIESMREMFSMPRKRK